MRPVEMLDQRVAPFDPVAIVPVFDRRRCIAVFGGVDVAADHPVDPALGGGAGDHFLVFAR